mgnify:CR=1|jgi:hypothetical protein
MKKVFFVCMTVGLLATSCDWFKKTEPTEPIVETEVVDSTITTTNDTTVKKADSAVAVVEQPPVKTETKKEVKK